MALRARGRSPGRRHSKGSSLDGRGAFNEEEPSAAGVVAGLDRVSGRQRLPILMVGHQPDPVGIEPPRDVLSVVVETHGVALATQVVASSRPKANHGARRPRRRRDRYGKRRASERGCLRRRGSAVGARLLDFRRACGRSGRTSAPTTTPDRGHGHRRRNNASNRTNHALIVPQVPASRPLGIASASPCVTSTAPVTHPPVKIGANDHYPRNPLRP